MSPPHVVPAGPLPADGDLDGGLLQEAIEYDTPSACPARLSVYVTPPPDAAGRLRTFKLYHRGACEGGDEDTGDMYEYYSEAKLPYAHYGAGANELDEPGRPPFPFVMAPNAYTGSVALGFKYDDYLDETDVVRYLRGEPITSQLVDRELATRLDEENGPVALNAHTP